MASLQSKLWQFFLQPIYSRKANVNAELNIKLSRTIEAPRPTKRVAKNNHIRTFQINKRNVFLLIPKVLRNERIVFYLHGGAYIAGITWAHWRFINKLTVKTGMGFAVIDYPVAPENGYTDTYEMVVLAYETLLREFAPEQIIFMGDSAGGGLALALAQVLKKKKLPQPLKMILLSPWLDVSMSNPDIDRLTKKDTLLSKRPLITAGKYYAKGKDTKIPEISPIYGDFEGLAEIHLFMGTHDLLLADARKLKHQLQNTSSAIHYYEYDKMFHVWMFFPIPEADEVMHEIMEIVE